MTIYDIAREAGVAASTVSRVINNKPGIKAETRERIQELLEKYNYTPDIAARGLVKKSTRMIGILIVDLRVAHHIDGAFYMEQELTKRGYCSIIMGTGPTDEKKTEFIRLLEQRRVEGIVLMGSMFMTDAVKACIEQYLPTIPVVIVNGILPLNNVSGVIVDEYNGIKDCVSYFVGKKRKKIAFVLDSLSPSNLNKQNGYIDGMHNSGFSDEELLLYTTEDSNPQSGYDTTVSIIKEHPDIDGIIYSIDLIAVGGIRAAYDLGYNVPEDIAMIGVDSSVYGEISQPKLTTLDNKLHEISKAAAELLIKGLDGDVQNNVINFKCEIKEREST